MSEATQRTPSNATRNGVSPPRKKTEGVKTENLEALAFKISPAFRKRFRQCAVSADLKLNQLLFEALDAWEEKRGIKSKNS